MFFKNKNLYKIDLFILISLILIILIGLVNLYSATISLKRNFMLLKLMGKGRTRLNFLPPGLNRRSHYGSLLAYLMQFNSSSK